jgi:peptidoglycan/LPS O-acetylase OafA/YrhL
LDFACVAFLAARFRVMGERLIRWKGLVFLSRHSLQVFAFHLIPIYLAGFVIAKKVDLAWWEQIMFIGFCVLGLFLIAWISNLVKMRFRKIRTAPPVTDAKVEIVAIK